MLPPNSPDFNPIENAFSKVKTMQRSLARRTVATLYQAIDDARRAVTVGDAVAFMRHRGHAAT